MPQRLYSNWCSYRYHYLLDLIKISHVIYQMCYVVSIRKAALFGKEALMLVFSQVLYQIICAVLSKRLLCVTLFAILAGVCLGSDNKSLL